jgi:hypothetical protein
MVALSLGMWRPNGFLAGWRGLLRFWGLMLAVLGAGAGVIEMLGPTARPEMTAIGPVVHADPLPVNPAPPVKSVPPATTV